MYKIGITGGIGAGKSLVSEIFKVLGIPVYNADLRAQSLMNTSVSLKDKIIELLGPESYSDDHLNRVWIADLVFKDRWLLNRLNGLVHPEVEVDYNAWHESQTGAPYTLKEAALLFDAGSFLRLDAVVVVHAAEEVRMERVMKRDHRSATQIKDRIKQQWPEDRRLLLADYLIENNGDKPLIHQVLNIHRQLIQ